MTGLEDLAPLFKLVAQANDWVQPMPARTLATHQADIIELCSQLNWLVPAGKVEQLTCTACHAPHKELVRFDRDIGYWHKCLKNNRVRLSAEDIRQFTFDRNAFMASLARSIGLDLRFASTHANGHLTYLGNVKSTDGNDRDFVVGIASNLDDPKVIATVMKAMEAGYKKGPGLVLTLDTSAFDAIRIGEHRFGEISPFFLYSEKLVFNFNAARQLLFELGSSKGTVGRPSFVEPTKLIVQQLLEKGEWPNKRKDQKAAILSNWSLVLGNIRPPSEDSLPRILNSVRKELKLP